METSAVSTKTSSFGTNGRYNHDSSEFYSKKVYANLKITEDKKNIVENNVPKNNLNRIFCKSSEKMHELPDNSVHLMVTSPPYNVGKEYDQDLTLKEYLTLLKNVFKETHRVLTPGGELL